MCSKFKPIQIYICHIYVMYCVYYYNKSDNKNKMKVCVCVFVELVELVNSNPHW